MRDWIKGVIATAAFCLAATAQHGGAHAQPARFGHAVPLSQVTGDQGRRLQAAEAYDAGMRALREGRPEVARERFQALLERWPALVRPRIALARAAALSGDCRQARAALAALGPDHQAWAQDATALTSRACGGPAAPAARLSLDMGLPGRDARAPWTATAPVDLSLAETGWGGARLGLAPSEEAWMNMGVEITDGWRAASGLDAAPRARLALQSNAGTAPRLAAETGLSLSPVAPEAEWNASLGLRAELDAEAEAGLARFDLNAGARPWGEARLNFGGAAQAARGVDGVIEGLAEMRLGLETPLPAGFDLRAEGGQSRRARFGEAAAADPQARAWAGAALGRELRGDMTAEVFGGLDALASSPGRWRAESRRLGGRLIWDRVGGALGRLEVGLFRRLGTEAGVTGYLGLSRGW